MRQDITPSRWRKSSICDSSTCVEVAFAGERVAMRDSKDPEGPVLTFSREAWTSFLADLRTGRTH